MDNKRANDITLLNNQIIILDAWNNWKKNTEDNYDARIKKVEEKIASSSEDLSSAKKAYDALDYGRSLVGLILIILCAILYIVPMFLVFAKPYAPYCAMATVLFVIPYFFWVRKGKTTFLANILYWLTNGLVFGGVLYYLSIRDGQPNLYYALFENPRFEQINRYFWYLTLGSIFILVVSMIVRKIHYNSLRTKLSRLIFECEQNISDGNEEIQNITIERDQLLSSKEKEYFGKYPIALPSYSIQDVQKLLQYMINHRADTIKEAINLKKNDEALQNIQDDVKALRKMQEKTNEDLYAMKKEQEEKEITQEEKEDLVY